MFTRRISLFLFAGALAAQNFQDVRPNPQQLAWQDLEIGVLIHFGPNTFMDREWGDGKADPSVFNPTQLDAEQWVKAAKAAGARYLVMVAKHHDGFCLYPSTKTPYTVKNSPYKEGKGDVVAEVSAACRRHGLRFGIYLSPWDRHEPKYADSKAYDDYYTSQLTELATHYGPLTEFWLDGAGSEGHVYDFVRYVRTMRTYQPNALLFASLDFMPYADIRWVGNEDGSAHEENWNVIDGYGFVRWRPAEADTPLRDGHWFWHPNSEAKLKSLPALMDTYHKTVGRGAQLVLGLAPDNRGLMPEVDVRRLQEFGAEVQRIYGQPVPGGKTYGSGREWFVEYSNPVSIDRVVMAEVLDQGQRVRSYKVQVWRDGKWGTVASGTTVGHKKIEIFPPETTSRVKLLIEESLGEPVLRSFQAYSASSR